MENVIINAGALPSASEEQQLPESELSRVSLKSDEPRPHVRAPVLRRNLTLILMSGAAAAGAGAGAVIALSGNADAPSGISGFLSGTFGEVFLRCLLHGAAFLAVEFLSGFFAFGDLLVWTLPFLYAEGLVLRLTAAGSARALPAGVVCLAAVVFGAAKSAELSELLLRLSRGGTVCMEADPKRSCALSFLGCLAAIAAGALFTALLSAYG